MNKLRKNEKGITLIALVVTIVVLLILAAVSISMLTGENGIIKKAKESKDATEQARVEELVSLAVNSLIGEKLGDTSGITPEMVAEEVNKMENRTDVYAEESIFPTNILFPEEGRKVGVDIDLSITEVQEEKIYSIAGLEDEAEKNIDLFNYEIIDNNETGSINMESLPTKEARITQIKPQYCNGYGAYDPDTDTTTNTNYAIIYKGEKISDTLVIPYQVEIDGEMYRITEVDISVYGEDYGEGGYQLPKVKTIIYPNTVKRIYSSADYNIDLSTGQGITNYSIEKVILSKNLQEIGYHSFFMCNNLENIEIPNSVTSIGEKAFSDCTGLTSITIPNSVTSIGEKAFYECTGLTSITIPNSITNMGNGAFYGCTGLTSITIPNSVTSIGNEAFSGCTGLTSITIPNSVTSIGNLAFSRCTGLTSITVPDSVTSIGEKAFSDCTGLTSITIPNSVTSIGSNAFGGWTSSQTINVQFKESEIPSGWSSSWNSNCKATINYLQ